MASSMFGGIHPASRKENTRRKPLMLLEHPPAQVSLPLAFHGGPSSLPLVKAGERVYAGQPIARPEGEDGAVLHASVSGRVEAIRELPHPWGGRAPAIVIANDGDNTPWPERPEGIKLSQASQEELMVRIEAAGIVDMGSDPLPAQVKILRARGRVDTLIVNAAECEPYVTADHRLLLERAKYIIQGGELLARCLGASHVVLVTEGDKLNAVESLERRLRRNKLVRLCTIRTRYPLGAEKQIVQTVTGREVPPGGSPLDVKCVVFNLATVYAIQDAFFRGRPLTHRAVTVTGGAVTRPRNLWVPIGTPWRVLLEACGGLREEAELMVTGGPMMGIAQYDLDAPVAKGTSAILAFNEKDARPVTPTACIRCGGCIDHCPMKLMPVEIERAYEKNDAEALKALKVGLCIECGCCAFQCPAHRPLVQVNKLSKTLVRDYDNRMKTLKEAGK